MHFSATLHNKFLLSNLKFSFNNLLSHTIHLSVYWVRILVLISLSFQIFDLLVDFKELVNIIVIHLHLILRFFENSWKSIHFEFHLKSSHLGSVGMSRHCLPEFLLETTLCLVLWLNLSSFSLRIFDGSNDSKSRHDSIILRSLHDFVQRIVDMDSFFASLFFLIFQLQLLSIVISNHDLLVSLKFFQFG